MDKEYIERFKEFNYELIKTNKDTAPCCSRCAYKIRCEKDTSWRGDVLIMLVKILKL